MVQAKKKINTRNKMYRTNAKIKKYLEENGFSHLYLFPHMRFMKDYHLRGADFDGFGWRKGDKRIYFFQFKTNKKCPKKVLEIYKSLSKVYNIVPCWISYLEKDREIKCWKVF